MATPDPQGREALARLSPRELRALIRSGGYEGPTSGLAAGRMQANLVVLPSRHAADFERFCRANSSALPIVARGRDGDPALDCGADVDVRSDLGLYRVYRDGVHVETVPDVAHLWRGGFTAFALGCWFANEAALMRAGVRLRHVERGVQGGLFRTNVPNRPVGRFGGALVVSMRPFARDDIERVTQITAANPLAHGAPVHLGDPSALGIVTLDRPDFGDALPPEPGEIPVFWACGLTGQEALLRAGLDVFITHEPGRMLVTDLAAGGA